MPGKTQQQPVDIVFIGHLGFQDNRTPMGTELSLGGAAYNCAVGASVLSPEKVGIVATVGPDFDIRGVVALGVNVEGVAVTPTGSSAHFVIIQLQDGSRRIEVDLGVAEQVNLATFPVSYASAQYIHLATAPPSQQLQWMQMLRALPTQPKISIDTVEIFARAYHKETQQVLEMADLVFMNEEEAALLGFSDRSKLSNKISILKRGAQGARYIGKARLIDIPAPAVEAVDTTGAGDVLAGAFLAMRVRNIPPVHALKEAVAIATASVTDFGVNHKYLSDTIQQVFLRWQASSKALHPDD